MIQSDMPETLPLPSFPNPQKIDNIACKHDIDDSVKVSKGRCGINKSTLSSRFIECHFYGSLASYFTSIYITFFFIFFFVISFQRHLPVVELSNATDW
jgi:hypothetical protein